MVGSRYFSFARILCAAFTVLFAVGGAPVCAKNSCLGSGAPEKRVLDCTAEITAAPAGGEPSALSSLYAARALAYMETGAQRPAIGDADKAVELDPKSESALLSRGQVYMFGGYYARAQADFTRVCASADEQNSGWAYYNLAILYQLQDNGALAQKQLNAGHSVAPKLFKKYLALLRLYNSAREARMADAAQSFDRARNLISSGDVSGAVESFEAAASSAPDNNQYACWLGSALYDAGKPEEALQVLLSMPQDGQWHYYIGLSYLKLAQYDKAKQAFTEAALEVPPKNRDTYSAQDATAYIARLTSYAKALADARTAAAKGDHHAAIAALESAVQSVDDPHAKQELDAQRNALVQDQNTRKIRIQGSIILSVLLTAGYFAFISLRRKLKAARLSRTSQKEDAISKLAELPVKEAVQAYFRCKSENPQDAKILATRLLEKVAISKEFELIRSFAAELEEGQRREMLSDAADTFSKSSQYEDSLDALQLLNLIPFKLWGEKECSLFVTAHLTTDDELLSNARKNDALVWLPDIPAAALMMLASIYASKKNAAFAELVLDKIPAYKWETPQWELYLRAKESGGALDSVAIDAIPVELRANVVEILARNGKRVKLVEFFNNEPRQKWLKEYYFYIFLYAVREHLGDKNPLFFEAAWEYYKQLSAAFNLVEAAPAHYLCAIVCEKIKRYDHAMEIYAKLASANVVYKDAAQRLFLLKTKLQPSQSPSADELLSPLLPKDFFPANQ